VIIYLNNEIHLGLYVAAAVALRPRILCNRIKKTALDTFQ